MHHTKTWKLFLQLHASVVRLIHVHTLYISFRGPVMNIRTPLISMIMLPLIPVILVNYSYYFHVHAPKCLYDLFSKDFYHIDRTAQHQYVYPPRYHQYFTNLLVLFLRMRTLRWEIIHMSFPTRSTKIYLYVIWYSHRMSWIFSSTLFYANAQNISFNVNVTKTISHVKRVDIIFSLSSSPRQYGKQCTLINTYSQYITYSIKYIRKIKTLRFFALGFHSILFIHNSSPLNGTHYFITIFL